MIGGTVARELVCGRCGEGFRLLTDPGAAEWVSHPDRADGAYCGGFAPVSGVPMVARRVNTATAAAHYRAGGSVAVSVNGEESFPVYRDTTTHDRTRRTWEELVDIVDSYGDRRQRFYAITPAPRP